VVELINRAIAGTDEDLQIEFPIFTKGEGRRVICSLHVAPRTDVKGAITGIVGVGLDVTERKEIAEAHIRAAQADAANQAKSRFLSTMSNEMRTPLNCLLGMLQVVLDMPEVPVEARSHLQDASYSGEMLLSLISDILDPCTVEAGKLELRTNTFDVHVTIKKITSMIHPKMESKKLLFNVCLSSEFPKLIVADEARVSQVLLNFLSNAYKFTKKGYVNLVCIATVDKEDRPLLRFEVQDSGCGIRDIDQKSLFRMFSRVREDKFEDPGGTGLGLAISHSLVKLMGGNIGMYSEYGEGSRFWFTCPLTPTPGHLIQPTTSSSPPSLVSAFTTPSASARPSPPQSMESLTAKTVPMSSVTSLLDNVNANPLGQSAQASNDLLSRRASSAAAVLSITDRHPEDLVTAGGAGPALLRRRRSRSGSPSHPHIFSPTSASANNLRSPSPMRHISPLPNSRPATTPSPNRSRTPTRTLAFTQISSPLPNALAPFDVSVQSPPPSPLPSPSPLSPVPFSPSTHMHRVLVVDDEKLNLNVAKAMLSRLGYHVDVARDGLEAIEMYTTRMSGEETDKAASERGAPYDVILMDCNMPRMSGYEATKNIRQFEANAGVPHVPIIALTASAMSEDRSRCLAAGMNDFLTKPIIKHVLDVTVRKWVNTPSLS